MAANYGDAVYAGAGGGSGAVARGESRAAEFDPGHRGRSTDHRAARFGADRSTRRCGFGGIIRIADEMCGRYTFDDKVASTSTCARAECRHADATTLVASNLPDARN